MFIDDNGIDKVIDVTDPVNIEVLDTLDFVENYLSFKQYNDWIFLPQETQNRGPQMAILNIENPGEFEPLGHVILSEENDAHDVFHTEVIEDYFYSSLFEGSEIYCVDWSDPENMQMIETVPIQNSTICGFSISDRRLIIGDKNERFHIFRIENDGSLELCHRLDLPELSDMDIYNRGIINFYIIGDFIIALYLDEEPVIKIIEIDEQETLEEICEFPVDIQGFAFFQLWGFDEYVFCHNVDGIKVFHFDSNMLSLDEVGYCSQSANGWTPNELLNNVSISEHYLYISSGTYTSIYDWQQAAEIKKPLLSHPQSNLLISAYPNPFNSKAIIQFHLPMICPVKLDFYTQNGGIVRSLDMGKLSEGSHQFFWDAEGLASGIYYLRLNAGSYMIGKQLQLLK